FWDDNRAIDNWADLSLDDHMWPSATVYPIRLKMSAQNIQGNKKLKEIKPVQIETRADGSFRVDMGVNFAGWTEIKLKGNPGDQVTFFYSERNQDEMTFNLHSAFVIGKT